MEQIVYESLTELKGYLLRLIKGIEDAVNYFRSQREDEGLKLLIPIIEGMQWSIEVVFKTKSVFETNGTDIDEEKTINLLKELVEALENQDYVLIADLLEYEVLDILKTWEDALNKVKELNRDEG